MEDKKITELFIRRDGSAVKYAAEKYGAYLHATARNILGDERDAEECVNDAYMAAWNSIQPNEPVDLRTYLSKLC
ncbi:MAG: RNA polymerase subunit sigma-70, partial [Clostridia bacterium]|nr:RNA polymerase subunit sigma-70 [Clostridia bacterium]